MHVVSPRDTGCLAHSKLSDKAQDGGKAADLQLALRFTPGSVTAGLAALAAAPPAPLPARAAGVQQPAPLPPAPFFAAPALKGPLEAGAGGLTPRPRSADTRAYPCIVHPGGGYGAPSSAGGEQGGLATPRGGPAIFHVGRGLTEAAAAASAPPLGAAGKAAGPAARAPAGQELAAERAGGSLGSGGSFSAAALRTWRSGQRVGPDAAPGAGPRPLYPELAPERSAASAGGHWHSARPRSAGAAAQRSACAPPSAWGGAQNPDTNPDRRPCEVCDAWEPAVREAPSAPPAPADVLAAYTAAAWLRHGQASAAEPDWQLSLQQARACGEQPDVSPWPAMRAPAPAQSAALSALTPAASAGPAPPRCEHAGSAAAWSGGAPPTLPVQPVMGEALGGSRTGAYPQVFRAQAAPYDVAARFGGTLKAAQGVVQLAAYPKVR